MGGCTETTDTSITVGGQTEKPPPSYASGSVTARESKEVVGRPSESSLRRKILSGKTVSPRNLSASTALVPLSQAPPVRSSFLKDTAQTIKRMAKLVNDKGSNEKMADVSSWGWLGCFAIVMFFFSLSISLFSRSLPLSLPLSPSFSLFRTFSLLSLSLAFFLPLHLSHKIYLSVHLSLYLCPSLPISLSISLYVSLSSYLPLYPLPLSTHLSLSLYLYPSLPISLSVSLCVSLSSYLSCS